MAAFVPAAVVSALFAGARRFTDTLLVKTAFLGPGALPAATATAIVSALHSFTLRFADDIGGPDFLNQVRNVHVLDNLGHCVSGQSCIFDIFVVTAVFVIAACSKEQADNYCKERVAH